MIVERSRDYILLNLTPVLWGHFSQAKSAAEAKAKAEADAKAAADVKAKAEKIAAEKAAAEKAAADAQVVILENVTYPCVITVCVQRYHGKCKLTCSPYWV